MSLQTNTPIPKDIPLDLPLPEWLLITILIFSFLLHIIFVNLMVGGSIVTLWAEIKGRKNRDYDIFAFEVAKTITVNKSIAVVLGVAPLLSINTLYTVYFYTANSLTGIAWILIIPLVTIAFLLTYLHKYTWTAMANYKSLHIAIIGLSVVIFLFIPLIFLTNVNLMMFPEKWGTVKGFLSALILPNVFPRYLEFLGACLTVTGVFIVWYNGRKHYDVQTIYKSIGRLELKKIGYSIAIIGLGMQILFGILVLFTLPAKGMRFEIIQLMVAAGSLLIISLWWVWKSLQADNIGIDRDFWKIVASIGLFMVFYGSSRQFYRQNALEKHQKLMHERTAEFREMSREARENPVEEEGLELDPALGDLAKGTALFQQNCGGCHKPFEKLVGPPVKEMSSIYKGKDAELKKWIVSPGKKRADMPQMPGFPQLSQDNLTEIAKYIMSIK